MNSLTFGVELEFCLATLPEGAKDPEPFDSRQVYSISDANAVNNLTKNQPFHPANLYYLKQRLQNDIVQRHLAETLISAGFPAITDADVRSRLLKQLKAPQKYRSTNFGMSPLTHLSVFQRKTTSPE